MYKLWIFVSAISHHQQGVEHFLFSTARLYVVPDFPPKSCSVGTYMCVVFRNDNGIVVTVMK